MLSWAAAIVWTNGQQAHIQFCSNQQKSEEFGRRTLSVQVLVCSFTTLKLLKGFCAEAQRSRGWAHRALRWAPAVWVTQGYQQCPLDRHRKIN